MTNNGRAWDSWGPLADRYRAERPRRILSLDGGGIRGVLTLRVLARLEARLAERLTPPGGRRDAFRLSDYFDLVAGTSTGAILAAGLARGMSVGELAEFYEDFGAEVFESRWLPFRWRSLYQDGPLERRLKEVFEPDVDLSPENLKCLLLVVLRNATTDSAWPISSNPFAKYNATQRGDCNLRVPLWQIVRASTAAPVYFPPEVISLDPADETKSFAFVDGGTTSYNNPAFMAFRSAVEPAYQLGWKRGESELLVVSLGTGSRPIEGVSAKRPNTNVASAARDTLLALMTQAAFDQDLSCRTVGRCTHGPALDREVGDLVPHEADGTRVPIQQDLGRAFTYARYDALLTRKGLDERGLRDVDPEEIAKLDAVENVEDLARVGDAVAGDVQLSHLGAHAPPPADAQGA